jgi:hypothetical protein
MLNRPPNKHHVSNLEGRDVSFNTEETMRSSLLLKPLLHKKSQPQIFQVSDKDRGPGEILCSYYEGDH